MCVGPAQTGPGFRSRCAGIGLRPHLIGGHTCGRLAHRLPVGARRVPDRGAPRLGVATLRQRVTTHRG